MKNQTIDCLMNSLLTSTTLEYDRFSGLLTQGDCSCNSCWSMLPSWFVTIGVRSMTSISIVNAVFRFLFIFRMLCLPKIYTGMQNSLFLDMMTTSDHEKQLKSTRFTYLPFGTIELPRDRFLASQPTILYHFSYQGTILG